jgi:heat-inducible transcriptional repressor
MSNVTINQRAQQILKTLVERHIQDGCPIGSKVLAEECALGLSPATIRHILADLEDNGYLTSLYTSSGRVPTSLGYRFFVNSLINCKPLEIKEGYSLEVKLDPDLDISNLLQSASSILSSLTQFAGIVTLPRRNRIELRQVEFLALSGNRVLVILVLNNREVQNRVIHTDKIYSKNELQEASNYINTRYAGKTLISIKNALLEAIREDRETMAGLLQAAFDVGNKAFVGAEETSKDYVIAGQTNLLNYASSPVDVERWKVLFNLFTQKQEILNLLEHALEAVGVQIFIGKESGYEVLDECSIVTTSYTVDGEPIGSLGVIGPVRMPYERVISAVDVTAKLLSAALNQG